MMDTPNHDDDPEDFDIEDDWAPEDWEFLIVDDNPAALATVRTLMMMLGLAPPHEATDGHQAMEIIRSQNLDCVITDLRMEPMSGVELVRLLRRSNEPINPNMKILGMSAYRDPDEIDALKTEGADGFVGKPLSVPMLRAALDRLIEKEAGDFFDMMPSASDGEASSPEDDEEPSSSSSSSSSSD